MSLGGPSLFLSYYEIFFSMVERFSEPILHASLDTKSLVFFFVPCCVMNLMKAALYMRGGEGRGGRVVD